MNKAPTELMARHGVTLAPAPAVPLSEPTSADGSQWLASTLDVDSGVAFQCLRCRPTFAAFRPHRQCAAASSWLNKIAAAS
jgi:hypothetical protein